MKRKSDAAPEAKTKRSRPAESHIDAGYTIADVSVVSGFSVINFPKSKCSLLCVTSSNRLQPVKHYINVQFADGETLTLLTRLGYEAIETLVDKKLHDSLSNLDVVSAKSVQNESSLMLLPS